MPHIEEEGFDGFGDGTKQMPTKRLSMLALKEAGRGGRGGGGGACLAV